MENFSVTGITSRFIQQIENKMRTDDRQNKIVLLLHVIPFDGTEKEERLHRRKSF